MKHRNLLALWVLIGKQICHLHHDGGFFERLVRSMEELLRKQLENLRVDYEELETLSFEVEIILNNRPITYY